MKRDQFSEVFRRLRALDGSSFNVDSGDIFGLIGPNLYATLTRSYTKEIDQKLEKALRLHK